MTSNYYSKGPATSCHHTSKGFAKMFTINLFINLPMWSPTHTSAWCLGIESCSVVRSKTKSFLQTLETHAFLITRMNPPPCMLNVFESEDKIRQRRNLANTWSFKMTNTFKFKFEGGKFHGNFVWSVSLVLSCFACVNARYLGCFLVLRRIAKTVETVSDLSFDKIALEAVGVTKKSLYCRHFKGFLLEYWTHLPLDRLRKFINITLQTCFWTPKFLAMGSSAASFHFWKTNGTANLLRQHLSSPWSR